MFTAKDMEEARAIGYEQGVYAGIRGVVVSVLFIGLIWVACVATIGM